MIRNILLVTWRNLVKNKFYTSINVIGLALGIAAFIAISAYVHFEKSYDRMHAGAEHIYRVESLFYRGNELTDNWATSTNGYARAMKEHLPGIESYARINWSNAERVITYNNIRFREEHVCFADSNFFRFFSFPLLKGDPKTVLNEVNTMVISRKAAKKYFGNGDPVGKFMEISTRATTYHCMVTGVFDDVPANSTLQFNFLLSWATTPRWSKEFWYQHESYTFVKLQPGTGIAEIEAGFPAVAEKYKTGPALKDLKWGIHLVPLADMHLNTQKQYEIEAKGNRQAVSFLAIMAYVILLIACINYINLATAKSVDRAREVGIRKVSGAHASQLVLQFFMESAIINSTALVLAMGLFTGLRSLLPQWAGNRSFGFLVDGQLIATIALVFFAGILLSGVYPALVLARLKPVKVLKGRFAFSRSGVLLRKGMVAFQFTASLLLIGGTLAVYRQISYMNSQATGVNLSQTMVIKAPVAMPEYNLRLRRFKNTIAGMNGVEAVTISGAVPGKAVGMFAANRRYGASKAEELTYEMLRVDHDFIPAYGLELVAGRAFDKSRASDSTGVVLNEAALGPLGFASAQAAIGGKVWLETLDIKPNEVIGVVKNYHQQSLQQKYTPLILFMDPALTWVPFQYFSVKVNPAQTQALESSLQKTWAGFFPGSSFDFFFLDEYYDRQYRQDRQFGQIFMVFSSLAVLIACMGLLGLTAYSTARRAREIGVRKVLGASAPSVMGLFTWEVVRLILLASLLALPLTFLLVRRWLNGYAFRVDITWWQMLLPVALLVIIAVATTFYITFRAALSNPVTTLRNE